MSNYTFQFLNRIGVHDGKIVIDVARGRKLSCNLFIIFHQDKYHNKLKMREADYLDYYLYMEFESEADAIIFKLTYL